MAIDAYPDESKESYLKLFTPLKERGLECPRLIVSDGAAGLTTAMAEVLPEAKWQHCKVHLIRKFLRNVRLEDRQTIADKLKEIWYTSHKSKALRWTNKIYNKYREKYPAAMTRLKLGINDTLTYLEFPEYSPKKISTSNVLERLNKGRTLDSGHATLPFLPHRSPYRAIRPIARDFGATPCLQFCVIVHSSTQWFWMASSSL